VWSTVKASSSKVYLPRLIVPMATMASGLVDFLVAVCSAYGDDVLVWGGFRDRQFLFLPVFVLLAVTAAIAISLWLAALDVEYRDVRFVIPFLVQLWMFLSPVVYPSALVPTRWRWLYGLNPMAGVIDDSGGPYYPRQIRQVRLWRSPWPPRCFYSWGGCYYFDEWRRTFADVI